MFTVEVKIMGRLILARSCNRIAGASGGPCLYVTDDGRFIEHHYDAGAAALAALLLAKVTNILRAPHATKAERWERRHYSVDHMTQVIRKEPRVTKKAINRRHRRGSAKESAACRGAPRAHG